MALELDGKVVRVLPEMSGEGQNGTWKKQQFVVETLGEYPKRICFQAWSEKTELVKALKEHDRVKVSFRLESREFNEKWYTDATAWRIDKLVANGANVSQPEQPQNQDTETKIDEEPALPENKEEDDLPF